MPSQLIETVWERVRKWAAANGHRVDDSYGVVDVAPM